MNKINFHFVLKNWHYSTWLVHYLTIRQLERIFETFVRKGSVVFDVGCGTKPYGALIENYCSEYYGLEYETLLTYQHKADLLATAYDTAIKDSSVDVVFAGAVLEHLEEPGSAIKEFNRILKPGGIVILSAPLFWHIHMAPRDFFRYTQYGFQYLLESNGFEVLEINALSGFWVTFSELLLTYVSRFNRGFLKLFPIIPLFVLVLQLGAFLLNKIDPKSEGWTWAYVAVGKRRKGGMGKGFCPPVSQRTEAD